MNKTLLLLMSLSVPFNAVAVETATCTPDLTVYFGNGMMATESEVQTSTRELKKAVESEVEGTGLEGRMEVLYAHNPSVGFVDDLLESAIQDMKLNEIQFWEYMSGVSAMPQALAEILNVVSQEVSNQVVSSSPGVQEHIKLYDTQLAQGRRVVLVGHSQGNLFANLAYRGVNPDYRSAFGLVAVATPSDHVAGGGNYTTLEEDSIIGAVPGSLPANFANFPVVNPNDLYGHQFIESYIDKSLASRERIVGHVFSQYAELEVPDDVLQAGAFTATLTWGSEPDVDLHVFEPNGSHVYYSSKQGQAGYLDRDDTNQYGPEHYTLPCENIEVGTYRVGVNYYRGSDPETAQITLETDTHLETRTKNLTRALGSDGNATPAIVYEVTIAGDESEGYTYTIE